MDKATLIANMRRVLAMPGVCPPAQQAEVLAQLEAMTEEQVAGLMAAVKNLPKWELLKAMRSGDTASMQQLIQKQLGDTP